VAGGYSTDLAPLDVVEKFDRDTQMWSYLPSMLSKRVGAAAVSTPDGKHLVVVGGHDGVSFLKSVEIFDVANQVWTALPCMSTFRQYCAAVCVGESEIVVAGGWNGTRDLDSVERLTLHMNHANNKLVGDVEGWTMLPPLNTARRGCGAAVAGNQLLVVGGGDESGSFATAETLILGRVQLPVLPTLQAIPKHSAHLVCRSKLLNALREWVSDAVGSRRNFQRQIEKQKEILESEMEEKQRRTRDEIEHMKEELLVKVRELCRELCRKYKSKVSLMKGELDQQQKTVDLLAQAMDLGLDDWNNKVNDQVDEAKKLIDAMRADDDST